jgi:hypothetical protein
MKSSQIFWGTFFLSIGILLLINNFFNISLNFDLLWKISPLILVFIGISIFTKNVYSKYFLVVLSALVLSLTLFALVGGTTRLIKGQINFTNESDQTVPLDSSSYFYEYSDYIKNAKLNFKGTAGSFNLKSFTNKLIDVNTFSEKDIHILNIDVKDSTANIVFGMKDKNINIGNKIINQVDFALNKEPVWDFLFDSGAARLTLDLEQFKVNNIDIDMGATDLMLKVGNKYPETKINIDAGASSINLKIPKSSGCELIVDAVLSSKNFDEFKKIESNKFRTENFNQSENKIFIELNCGVSSINIKRY